MSEGASSRSDRTKLVATFTVAAILFLLVIGISASFIWSRYQLGSEAHQNYSNRAYSNQQKAAEQIASVCGITSAPSSIVSECLKAEVEAYTNQYATDEDLKAQKDMAFWALWMFIASAFSAAISIVALILLFVSLRQTRIAIKDTRDIGEKQVRAYVGIAPQIATHKVDHLKREVFFQVTFTAKNSGVSPALNFRYAAGIFVEETEFIPNGDFLVVPAAGETDVVPSNVIPPGSTIDGSADVPAIIDGHDVRAAMEKSSGKKLVLMGVAFYEDVFGNERRTSFCFDMETAPISDPKKGKGIAIGWSQSPRHNSME